MITLRLHTFLSEWNSECRPCLGACTAQNIRSWRQCSSICYWMMYSTLWHTHPIVFPKSMMQINGQFYVLTYPKSYAMRTLYATTCSLNLPPRIREVKGTIAICCNGWSLSIYIRIHCTSQCTCTCKQYKPWGRVLTPVSMLWSKSHHKSPETVCKEIQTCECKPSGFFQYGLASPPPVRTHLALLYLQLHAEFSSG